MKVRPTRRALMVVAAAGLGVCLGACAGAEEGPALEPALQRVLDEIRLESEAPGALLGLRLPGGRTLAVASGVSDLESGRPLETGDAYFLGSISKTYTSVVTLRLVEEGRLALEDPLSVYLPSFPRGDEITVRHLLAHTSGLKDFYSYIYFRPDRAEMIELVTREWTQAELLGLSGRFGHWFDPGTDWSYSSTNYFLLGVLIERVTGASLAEAYRSYVYEPLGLRRTWLTWHEPAADSLRTTGYLGAVEGWEHSEMFGELGPTTLLDRSPVEWGAGGLAATAGDALSFLDALFEGRLLTPASLAAMRDFRPTPALGVAEPGGTEAPGTDGYGLGLVKMERQGITLLGHGGLFTGHTAGLWHAPTCGVTIALYFNRGFVGQRTALDRILSRTSKLSPAFEACRSG